MCVYSRSLSEPLELNKVIQYLKIMNGHNSIIIKQQTLVSYYVVYWSTLYLKECNL